MAKEQAVEAMTKVVETRSIARVSCVPNGCLKHFIRIFQGPGLGRAVALRVKPRRITYRYK